MAAVRELREETGLHGTVVREVARIWRGGTRGHYFTMEADGEVGAPETLDNYGGAPAWVPVSELPVHPALAPPAVLADRPLAHRRLADVSGGTGGFGLGPGRGLRGGDGRP